jgi:hypothetical protein
MSAEDNLQPKQFKWTPNKYDLRIRDHFEREHTDMTAVGGWSRTYQDDEAHKAAHAKDPDGIAGTTPHKHFKPKDPYYPAKKKL